MIRPVAFTPTNPLPPQRAALAPSQDPADEVTLNPTPATTSLPQNSPILSATLAATIPGPLGQRLAALPVRFLVKKKFHLPFTNPHKTITPHEAAQSPANVLVQTQNQSPLPLKIPVLEALLGDAPTDDALVDQLKLLKKDGLQFTSQGLSIDPYAAYHALTETKQPVEVRLGQLPLTTLRPGQPTQESLQTNLEKARKAHTPAEKLAYLGSYHDRFEPLLQDLGRLEKSPDYAFFRTSITRLQEGHFHLPQAVEFTRLLAEPMGTTTAAERLETFARLGLVNSQNPGSLNQYAVKQAAWELYRKEPEATASLLPEVAKHEEPLPVLQHCHEHPEHIPAVLRLLAGGHSPEQASQHADKTGPELELTARLGKKPELIGHFLPHVQHEGLPELAAAAVTVNLDSKAAEKLLEQLPDRPEATRALARILEHRIPAAEAPALLEQIRSWPGSSTLIERVDALHGLTSRSAQREPVAQALKAHLEHRPDLKRASEAVKMLCQHTGKVDDALKAGLPFSSNPPAYELLGEMLANHYHAEPAAELVNLLLEPSSSRPTQEGRFQTFRDLGLMKGEEPLSNYAVKAAYYRAHRAGVGKSQLESLTKLAFQRKSPEAVALAIENLSPPLLKALEANLPVNESLALLARLGQHPEPTLEALAGLGQYREFPPGLGQLFLDALEKSGVPSEQALPNLKLLTSAVGARQFDLPTATRVAELFSTRLAGEPEECRVFAQLLGTQSVDNCQTTLATLKPPAGNTTLTQRFETCRDTGVFSSRFDQERITAQCQAVTAQLQAGCSPKETAEQIKTLAGFDHSNRVELMQVYAASVADKSPGERQFYLDLIEHHHHAAPAARIAHQVAAPLEGTTLASRTEAFKKLFLDKREPFNVYVVKQAGMDHLRADVEAGSSLAEARQRVEKLMGALKKWPAESVEHAFQYARGQVAQPQAWGAFADQLEHGLKPEVASESLERARGNGDFELRLKALRGLGKAGDKLDKSVAMEFQSQLETRLQAGVDKTRALASLELIAERVGSRGLETEPANEVARYWGEHLAADPEATRIFGQVLSRGWKPAEAIALFEQLEKPAGSSTLAQRFDTASPYLGADKQAPLATAACRAVTAHLEAGWTCPQVTEELEKVGQAMAWDYGRNLAPALEATVGLAGRSDQLSVFRQLLGNRYEAEPAREILEQLARPAGGTSLTQRAEAFDRLGLMSGGAPWNNYRVKDEFARLMQAELSSGRSLGQVESELAELKAAVKTRTPQEARQILEDYGSQSAERRPPYRSLLAAGFPCSVALASLDRAGPALDLHVQTLTGLGNQGNDLSDEVVSRLQAVLNAHPEPAVASALGDLSTALGARPRETGPALGQLEQTFTGRWEALRVLAGLIGAGVQTEPAVQLVERFQHEGGVEGLHERFVALTDSRLFAHHPEDAAAAHEILLGQLQSGRSPADSSQLLQRIVTARGYNGLEPFRGHPGRVAPLAVLLEDSWNFGTSFARSAPFLQACTPEMLEQYPAVRNSGADFNQAVWILNRMAEGAGRTTPAERVEGLQRLIAVNDADRRTWVRMAVASLNRIPDVKERQLLVPLVAIYRKLMEMDKPALEAADLVASIFSSEQAAGVSHEAMKKRLEDIAEVVKLEVRPGNTTVLLDSEDKVVFSGVMVKKRKAPTA